MSDDLEIEFFFDIASPYSYLASTRIDRLEAETGLAARWRPFLLGGVFKATGNSPPAQVRPKARYMLEDLKRWADHYGVDFEMPAKFPINSLSTQRALVAAGELEAETLPAFAEHLYRAYWTDGRDVSEPDTIAEVADAVSLPADEIVERLDAPDIKETLRSITDEAVDRGAFGAPTFFVGDEMFWGNDRLDFLCEAADAKTGG